MGGVRVGTAVEGGGEGEFKFYAEG